MNPAAPPGAAQNVAAPVREDLVGKQPYGAPQLHVPVQLNTNENPYPPSARLAAELGAAVADIARGLNRYPDREAMSLRAALASYLDRREGCAVEASQVWAANGSNEVMLQLMQAFGGPSRTALGFSPTYSMYATYCRDTFTRWVTVSRADDFALSPEAAVAAVRDVQPALVVLASPNNPTGTALPLDVVKAICSVAPGLVVVDEAYAEFRRPGVPSALSLLSAHPQLVVTRTMSKAFALAGARVGYLAAAPAIVDALRLVRLPYHLSSVTQAVAITALSHADDLQDQLATIRGERDALVSWFRQRGTPVADSDANFVLFGGLADAHAVWDGLLARGVLVRELGPAGWLRVTIGTPQEMASFRAALDDVSPSPTEEHS